MHFIFNSLWSCSCELEDHLSSLVGLWNNNTSWQFQVLLNSLIYLSFSPAAACIYCFLLSEKFWCFQLCFLFLEFCFPVYWIYKWKVWLLFGLPFEPSPDQWKIGMVVAHKILGIPEGLKEAGCLGMDMMVKGDVAWVIKSRRGI